MTLAPGRSGPLAKTIFALSLMFFCLSNLTGISSLFAYMRIGIMLALVSSGFFYMIMCGHIKGKLFLLWGGGFLFTLLSSMLYTPSVELAWQGISAYIIPYVTTLMIIQPVEGFCGLNKISNFNIFAAVLLCSISVTLYGGELFSGGRFWTVGNPNQIMVSLLFPVFILIFRTMLDRKRRPINLFFLTLCSIVILFTGSRKGIVVPFIFTLVFVILNNRKYLLKRITVTILCTAIIGYLVFNITELYLAIGRRIEWLFITLFDPDNAIYFSDVLRIQLRRNAMQMFYESPLIGQGINAFAFYYGVYSHNNYSEILASTGVVGVVSYYWVFVYCFAKLIIQRRRLRSVERSYCDFAISLLVANLVYDWGAVSYNTMNAVFSIAIALFITQKNQTNEGDFCNFKNDLK